MHPRERAGSQDDERGDFRRAVDVVPRPRDVRREHERGRADEEDGRELLALLRPEKAADAGKPAEQRERANAGEMRVRSARASGPLAFEADRQSAYRRREHVEEIRLLRGHLQPAGMAAHGRYGRPCPVCGTPIQRIKYASNEANYCPTCQTGGKLLADRSLSRLLREDWPKTLEDLERVKRAR